MDILHNFLAALATLMVMSLTVPAFAQGGSTAAIKLSTVVIDAGHGGKDSGCISPSGKTKEKDVVLDIALKLADKIRKGYPSVKVVLTRDDDTFVTLQGRADLANKNAANLFISIHVNSVDGKVNGPNGYSVHILGQYTSKKKDLYAGNMDVVRRENSVIKLEDNYTTRYEGFDPNDPESYIFMNLMQNAFLEQSLRFAQNVDSAMKKGPFAMSRGIHQDPFYVLWRTAMPAVLIECGFMSNSSDREKLITESGRDKIATNIYKAFATFKKGYDGSSAEVEFEEDTVQEVAEPEKEKVDTEIVNKSEKSNSEKTTSEKVNSEKATYYGTQVLVSSKVKSEKDSFFKGYDFKMVKVGNVYKYIIGVSANLDEAKEINKKIKDNFSNSFLVMVDESGKITRQ